MSVGSLEVDCKEKPTLADLKRWSNLVWKNTFGVNLYEMYGDKFQFEFPNKHMAEQVLRGQWSWKNMKFNLISWSPTEGCVSNSIFEKRTWIRAIGVPLHLWSHKVFYEIGQLCGGWVATEEETEIRNHMKWARILVANDGRSIPNEVTIVHNGITFVISIWVENKPRFEIQPERETGAAGKDEAGFCPVQAFTQKTKEGSDCGASQLIQKSHLFRDLSNRDPVGDDACTAGRSGPVCPCEEHMLKFNDLNQLGRFQKPKLISSFNSKDRPDYAAQVISNNFIPQTNSSLTVNSNESINDSLIQSLDRPTMQSSSITVEHSNGVITTTTEVRDEEPTKELVETGNQGMEESRVVDNIPEIAVQNSAGTEENWEEVEEVQPLNIQPQLLIKEKENETSLWVQQNMLKLGKLLGVDFHGHEEEALELLLQVDSCRIARRMESDVMCKKTRFKGAQELKSLIAFDVKFKCSGDRHKRRSSLQSI